MKNKVHDYLESTGGEKKGKILIKKDMKLQNPKKNHLT